MCINFVSLLFKKRNEKLQEVNNRCDHLLNDIEKINISFNNLLSNEGIIQKEKAKTIYLDYKSIVASASESHLKTMKKSKNFKKLQIELSNLDNRFKTFYSTIDTHNHQIWRNKIQNARKIIGNVEGIQLDNQQMMCIVKESNNHLVLAGAGTGKTTTIIGKIKYVLGCRQFQPEDILVLSFTNKSAGEINQRIKDETGCNIDACTFHKLGLNILSKAQGIVPKITQLELKKFIKEQIEINCRNTRYSNALGKYLYFDRVLSQPELSFRNEDEYNEYLRLNPPLTAKGELVKSYGELEIANFLYQNGIEYQYEAPYIIDTRTEEYGQYHPDFYLPGYNTYIEYFGIDRDGNVPDFFLSRGELSAKDAYNDAIKWKRETHQQNDTKLIECYAYENMEGHLLESLEKRLLAADIQFHPISSDELWAKINAECDNVMDGIIELFETIINLIKSNRYTLSELKLLIKNHSNYRKNKEAYGFCFPYASFCSKDLPENPLLLPADGLHQAAVYCNTTPAVRPGCYPDINPRRNG